MDDTKNSHSNEDPPSREDDTIASHEEFVSRFSKILETIKEKPLTPVEVDEEWAATDKELTDALAAMFAKVKVEVTPELLEKRQRLREKYPEILGSITDEELDS
ncbi:hypothetical protein LPJ53_003709 [Coemansia erecta]|uniref:Uncharacterized protein n=1 Tax=Coemansia erecta TaxID=147472 RepID=A0A9W8CRP3_9FUNG|nr:hypothetical protein LPJ53_003709 [Coemansia erecta]